MIIEACLLVTIGGCTGAIANIITSNYTKKAKDKKVKEETEIRNNERTIVEDEYKTIIKQKDKEIKALKKQNSSIVDIEEI